MCTALMLKTGSGYFARNLDLEYAYNEEIVIAPRGFSFAFRQAVAAPQPYAMIGTAYLPDDIPLYYDAVNEKGLGMAALNFPNEAQYQATAESGKTPIAPFEMIPWVLSRCATVKEATELLLNATVCAFDYSKALPCTPLHWLLSDGNTSLAVEPLGGGLCLFENPVHLLTNSPALPYHLTRLADFTALSSHMPSADFGTVPVSLYSRGMGAVGLPGDLSSSSRFVRAAFMREYSVCESGEGESVSQVFHILNSVAHVRGCVTMPDGRQEITVYSSCCNMDTGVYYYKTYNGSHVHAVSLHAVDLEGEALYAYPMRTTWQPMHENSDPV